MHTIRTSVFLLTALFTLQFAQAQKTPAKKPATTTFQKIKPPKLQTTLGTYKDSVGVTPEVANNIIAMPLKIYDDKKTEYAISSYQFLYRKRGVTEDEQGKLSPATSISSDMFKVTPLPDLWVNLIKEQLKSGEEFFFFDVIAKDAQGRVMYAPNLKIMIK